MENFIKLATEFSHKFHTWLFLLLLFVAEISFFAFIDDWFSRLVDQTGYRFSCYGLVLGVTLTFWLIYRFKAPRNEKNKIGVLISVFAEENDVELALKRDFVEELEKNVETQGLSDVINIIVLKNHLAEKVKNPEQIRKFNKKIKAHYCIYGDIKKRPDGTNGEKYYLNLSGYVVHAPIDLNLSRKLGEEMSKALPREISFAENDSFKGFKITSGLVSISVKYIVGIAAFVSWDYSLSYRLHTALLPELENYKGDELWTIEQIKKSTMSLLSDEETMLARIELQKGEFASAKSFLTSAIRRNNSNYGAYLVMAQIAFLHEKDINQSFYFIRKAREVCKGQMQWIYSLAFLFFWNNEFKNALKQCGKISKNYYDYEELTAEEVVQFNLKILELDESKYQLYFWIGFVSYKKLDHLGNALDYFEKYLELAKDDRSQSDVQIRATAYISEIKATLNIS